MSKRTATYTETDIFCDVPGCNRPAYGPCAMCQNDVCRVHGEPPGGVLSYNGLAVLVCPAGRTTPLDRPLESLDHFEDNWHVWNRRHIWNRRQQFVNGELMP